MYEAKFEVEAITPIFMRGADQSQAEIRASSIKGLMRWWFRALAGNYFGNDIVGLKKVEDYVFGSTGGRSRVVIEIEAPEPCKMKIESDLRYDYRKNRLQPRIKIYNIPEYLLFSIKMFVDEIAKDVLEDILNELGIKNRFKDQKHMETLLRKCGQTLDSLKKEHQRKLESSLKYYPSGKTFILKLVSFDEYAFRLAVASLWLLSNIGGIGFRSRRGAGSVIVEIKECFPNDLKNELIQLFTYNWKCINEAQKFWERALKAVCEKLKLKYSEYFKDDEIPKYPNLKHIIILEAKLPTSSWVEALQKLQEIYAGKLVQGINCNGKKRWRYEGGVRFEFADRDDPNCKDFSHIVVKQKKDLSKLGRETTERRFYFGLPLIYSNWNTQVVGYNIKNKKEPYKRRASSVILTVKKLRNGINEKYVPLVIILPYQFLPDHKGEFMIDSIKIQIKENNKPLDNKWFVNWLKEDVVKRFVNCGFDIVYPKGGNKK